MWPWKCCRSLLMAISSSSLRASWRSCMPLSCMPARSATKATLASPQAGGRTRSKGALAAARAYRASCTSPCHAGRAAIAAVQGTKGRAAAAAAAVAAAAAATAAAALGPTTGRSTQGEAAGWADGCGSPCVLTGCRAFAACGLRLARLRRGGVHRRPLLPVLVPPVCTALEHQEGESLCWWM